MTRRSARRLPAVLTALVVLALAVVVGVSCVQVLMGLTPWVSFDAVAVLAATLTPQTPAVLVGAGALALVGVVLVGVALLPGAPTVLPLAGDDPRTGATRRGLRAALTTTVDGVGGVVRADVRVRRRRVTAVVRTPDPDAAVVRGAVDRALTDHIARLGPTRTPRVRVRAVTLRRRS